MSAALMQGPTARQAVEWHTVTELPVAEPSMRIRLTRRGRLVLSVTSVTVVALVLALVASLFAPQAVASDRDSAASFGYVVAAPGASLWQLATELDSSVDPRDLVAEIVQLNQLQGAEIMAGQPIAVPLRYADSDLVMTASELGL